jgi:hypothetical protein
LTGKPLEENHLVFAAFLSTTFCPQNSQSTPDLHHCPQLYKQKLMRMQTLNAIETKLNGADHAAKQVLRACLLMMSM